MSPGCATPSLARGSHTPDGEPTHYDYIAILANCGDEEMMLKKAAIAGVTVTAALLLSPGAANAIEIPEPPAIPAPSLLPLSAEQGTAAEPTESESTPEEESSSSPETESEAGAGTETEAPAEETPAVEHPALTAIENEVAAVQEDPAAAVEGHLSAVQEDPAAVIEGEVTTVEGEVAAVEEEVGGFLGFLHGIPGLSSLLG